jgi:hypothetical protein
MTPLAYAIVKETWLPEKRRTFFDQHGLLRKMADIHCFDISDVFELADDLAKRWHGESSPGGLWGDFAVDQTFAFLPAPKTWIEWDGDGPGEKVGVLLEEQDGLALCTVAGSNARGFWSADEIVIALQSHDEFELRFTGKFLSKAEQSTLIFRLYAFLALINSPETIGRRQHGPHRTLERIARKRLGYGVFQLHPWTEIKLRVNKPDHIDDGEPHEPYLTGKRALHFCRAHVRVQRGKLVYVTSHWRGDPSIGIRQSRYQVTT